MAKLHVLKGPVERLAFCLVICGTIIYVSHMFADAFVAAHELDVAKTQIECEK